MHNAKSITVNDSTSDLTDQQLAAAADEGWRSPGSHGLRAVAALARQGWAPVGTGPSIEDLGPLIVRLGDMAIEAANAGQSDDAGMLTWACLVLGERVNEDAPDHVANVSNMVEPAPDIVYSRALQPTTMQPMKISDDIPPGPFSEHELRKQWNQQADEHNQWGSLASSEQIAWAQVCAIAWASKAGLGQFESMPVPSDIQQALVDAESALADIAEGRASRVLTPLEWAEGRAFRALGQIRPVMRQFSVRTSERPTMPVVKDSLTTAPAPPAALDLDALLSPEGAYEPGTGHEDGAQLIDQLEWWAPVYGCDTLDNLLDRIRDRILPHLRPPIAGIDVPGGDGDYGDVLDLCAAEGVDPRVGVPLLKRARETWGNTAHSAPPADGEVAELVEWLVDHAAYLQKMARLGALGETELPERLNEAAELLQRRHPAPVPVSERLPQAEDCDAEGRCWWYRVEEDGVGEWFQRVPCQSAEDFILYRITHWLPFHALPLPAGEVRP